MIEDVLKSGEQEDSYRERAGGCPVAVEDGTTIRYSAVAGITGLNSRAE